MWGSHPISHDEVVVLEPRTGRAFEVSFQVHSLAGSARDGDHRVYFKET